MAPSTVTVPAVYGIRSQSAATLPLKPLFLHPGREKKWQADVFVRTTSGRTHTYGMFCNLDSEVHDGGL